MALSVPPVPVDPVAASETGLIGRDQEAAIVSRLLASVRLVTLVGPGGVGKTSLAAVVAQRSNSAPVHTCRLAPVEDPGGVRSAISEALGFPSLEAACVALTSEPRLLVVDNVEHHLDVVARASDELLAACAGLTILVTSREPLELDREHVVVLEPLPIPAADEGMDAIASSPAVQLFVQRARAVGATFELDGPSLATVAAIVRGLDGLPLAIELAAARTRSLGLADILRHLDARFELLTRRNDRGPDRHRSLEAAIGWSYERLEPAVQRFFARLGAFCGPFTLDAVHSVAADPGDTPTITLDRLDLLVSRSLLSPVRAEGETVYLLPESLRLYARRQLEVGGEADVCDARCVDHYVRFAVDLAVRGQLEWSGELVHTLTAAQLNLQDSIRWCLAHDESPERATWMYLTLWGLVHNGRAETIRELGERILERWPEPRDAPWTVAAAVTGNAALSAGHVERGRELATQALQTGHEGIGSVIAARGGYLAAVHDRDDAAARSWSEHMVAGAEAAGLEPFVVEGELFRALTLARMQETAAATEVVQRARRRAYAGASDLLHVFADLAVAAIAAPGDPDAARRSFVAAVGLAERHRYAWGVGAGHRALGALALVTGDLATARDELMRSLDTFLQVGQLAEVAGTLRWIAGSLVVTGRGDRAPGLLVTVVPSPSLLGVFERGHLDALLAELPVARAPDVGAAVAAARAALANPGMVDAAEAEAVPAQGVRADAVPAQAVPAQAVPADAVEARAGTNRWVLEGAVWELTYEGRTVRLPDAKGLADVASLLARPGREVAATELMGAAVDSADLGPAIDAPARRAYERRIMDLQEDLEEAEDFGDLPRAERARTELDQLVEVLTAATGLGGRGRRSGGSEERARSAVTRRIRDVMRRIGEVHPPLGEHLMASVRTGRWCAYVPAEPVAWITSTRP